MVNERKEKGFQSRWGFILAAVGSAVGMANVWGFPYKVGANGGGAFLIIYALFIFIFSLVGLPSEFAMGRKYKLGALRTYEETWGTRGKTAGKVGGLLGWLPIIGSICITIGYAIIVAYVFKAFTDSLTGTLMTVDPQSWFSEFSTNQYSVVGYHILIVALTLLTLIFGAKSIEKSNKIMMPIFFVLFVILAVRVAMLPGAVEGYKFMFIPRWESLADPMVWIWAMGQAFFSLSITGCIMVTYGSYMRDDENVVKVSKLTGLFDTIAAVVASLVIIPACFAYNLGVASGTGLLFVTLPAILQDIPFGGVFAVLLYIAMIFAGVSSLQSLLEGVANAVMYKFPKVNRKITLVIIGLVILAIGVNIESINSWGPYMDIVSIYVIPIGATIGAITWFYVAKKDDLLGAINQGSEKKHGNIWYGIGKYIYVPSAIILCLVAICLKVSF